ncbi:hypothetical protein MLD38_024888 [Melastoma candidum]|uniref:Uncharacterized protein n=1 Tax=Melastoma candidum TaxID=119954 RepID=A0ACB9NV06_9MYRT|nr:hypothetical protein MLD38_024888 [Melastoma candidum]
MSSSGGGGGGGRGGGGGDGARVSMSEEVRRTIHNIREITGKQHSDEDVYAMLEVCSMDPDETTQKLFYLDTFHEVKSKRERRRGVSIRSPESKFMMDGPGRAAKGNRIPRTNHVYSGAGKVAPSQREKFGNAIERGPLSSTSSLHKGKSATPSHSSRASTPLQNGPYRLSNGSTSQGLMPCSSTGGVKVPPVKCNGETKENSKVMSDPATGELQEIAGKADNQSVSATFVPETGFPDLKLVTNSLELKPETHLIASENLPLIKSVETQKLPGSQDLQTPLSADQGSFTPKAVLVKESSFVGEASDSIKVVASKVAELTVDASSHSLPMPGSRVYDGKPVTFPNHFKVPETLKNGLTFGSFDMGFGAKADISIGITSDDKSSLGVDMFAGDDVTVQEPFPSQNEGLSEQREDSSLALVREQKPLENHVLIDNGQSHDQEKVNLITEVPQNHVIQEVQANGFGLVPSILGGQLQPKALDAQARDPLQASTFANGNASTISSPAPTPVPALQSSIAVSPQPIPVFRQPYPLNYFPYAPFFPPFYMPTVPHLISPNGFTQQPSAGNYLPPAVAAQGIKHPFPSFKPGSNAPPIGIPSAFGPYGTAALGFNPGQSVTLGNAPTNEEMPSQLKENHTHSAAVPQGEAPAVWVPPLLGQDTTGLQVNSLYNLSQGPHVAFSPAQAGHIPFGMHQPAQNIVAASNVHPLLQQSQPGTVDTGGPPSNGYQHPQHGQMNWNTNF